MKENELSNIDVWNVIGENNNDEEGASLVLYNKAENQMYKGNYRKAIDLYEMAANLGFVKAQSYLADLYFCGLEGTGIEPNHPKALKWFQKLAEQGEEIAKFNCDYLYYFGVGTTKDDKGTFEAVLQSSAVEERNALKLAGQMYYFGEGVKQDVQKGIEYFKKAADQGDLDAQIAVCVCCYETRNNNEIINYLKMIEENDYELTDGHKNWLEHINCNNN
jgi:uncharacterized protein